MRTKKVAESPAGMPAIDSDMFLRIWDRQKMTAALARQILTLDFDEDEKARMHELSIRNSAGTITRQELAELDKYVDLGTVLAIMHVRARTVLKQAGNSRA